MLRTSRFLLKSLRGFLEEEVGEDHDAELYVVDSEQFLSEDVSDVGGRGVDATQGNSHKGRSGNATGTSTDP
ncbi:hypothetical protein V6N11_034004 [Hibiscus sabdariffa]|uniref:Uncharacterized protein n=1 Tax=Hibiscus sabdariffa TaxID=183260 RepID=A0ABR2S133_9ROSI